MSYLLDTNVVSELRRRTGAPSVRSWVDAQSSSELFLSVITILEIETGILTVRRRDPRQADLLQSWLSDVVLPGFAGRVLPIDLAVARQVARLHVPDRAPQHDALIGGTALAHGLVLVTRNVSDFPGVECLDPWSA